MMNKLGRHWGILITLFYGSIVLFLLTPFSFLLGQGYDAGDWRQFMVDIFSDFDAFFLWVWVASLVVGQALLLTLSVDISRKRLPPKRHIAASVIAVTIAVGLLSAAIISSVAVVIDESAFGIVLWLAPVLWVVWGVVFYLFRKGVSKNLDRMLKWLFAGSVLELLIVIPCHIIVRQRDSCCAPDLTGMGISTGIAVMLMCFGPGVIILYQKRLSEYSRKKTNEVSDLNTEAPID